MNVVAAVLIGLAMGVVFGVALEKSRVFEPGVIVGQMRLRNFIMLKVFLAAVATGLVVLAVLNGFGLTKLHPKPLLVAADIIGGLLLGAGIALAGACPGTVFAQIGAGYRDAWLTLAGGLADALTYVYAEPQLKPLLGGGPGPLTFDKLASIPFWLLALGFAAACIALLVVLERRWPWRAELGADLDGVTPDPEATLPSAPGARAAA